MIIVPPTRRASAYTPIDSIGSFSTNYVLRGRPGAMSNLVGPEHGGWG